MVDIFTQILDMNLMGSVIIVLVLLCRLLLRRVPRFYSYVLWFAVLFRLLCPVSLASPVSVLPDGLDMQNVVQELGGSVVEETVRYDSDSPEFADAIARGDIGLVQHDTEGSYILVALDDFGAPDTIESAWLPGIANIWMAGLLILFAGSMTSYLKFRRRLVGAVPHDDGYYLADHIDSPFVVGVITPKIYLPSDLPESHRPYILSHERHHIRRFDHLVKLAAFAALCLHWFNPLVWLMFHLLVKDMEMSCDEAVLKNMGREIRSDYSALLLTLSAGSQRVAWTPLAFGEGDIAGRIKNVLSWRKPAAWVTALALVMTCAVTVSAVTDPVTDSEMDGTLPLRNSLLYWGTMERSGSSTDDLNFSQLSHISKSLNALTEDSATPSEGPASNHLFTVSFRNLNGEFSLHYGYQGGSTVLTLERLDSGHGYWQITDQALEDLLHHMFLCSGSISVNHNQIPDGLEPYEIHHWGGCYTHLYRYHCPICDQDGVLTTSFACGCSICGDFWEDFSAMIKQHGKAIP